MPKISGNIQSASVSNREPINSSDTTPISPLAGRARSSTPIGIFRALHIGLLRVRGFFHRIAAVLPGLTRMPAKRGERVQNDDFKIPEGINSKPAASATVPASATPEVAVSIEGDGNLDVDIDRELQAALKSQPREQVKRIQQAFDAADRATGRSTQEGVPLKAGHQDLAGMKVVLRMALLSPWSQQQLVKGMSNEQLKRVDGTRPKVGRVSGLYAATIQEVNLREKPYVR
ncbi:MAG: hypothetical protein WDO56_30040 [Gammaproteobacteria bacterium]